MKRNRIIYIAAGIIVVVLVAAFLLTGGSTSAYSNNQPVSAAQLQQLEGIASNYSLANRVGIGSTVPYGGTPQYPTPVVAPKLTNNSKPEVLYIGAEYCPYCAVTRWGLILAMMRFGSFNNLTYMASTPNDRFPDTPTFSFRYASYSSNLLSFVSVETQDRSGSPLQQPTQFEGELFSAYDPETTICPSGGCIPFIDFANSSVQVGAMVSPQLLAGDTQLQVIAALSNSSSQISQAVIGNANVFTAYICKSSPGLSNATPCRQGYVTAVMQQH